MRAHILSITTLIFAIALTIALAIPAAATSRIKDIADFEGVRENQLVGYGLVVGLNGTGDTLNNAPFTRQSLRAMLERLGVNTPSAELRTANVAAVMVTANLPAFATQGTRIDITVSALGDADSLQGGTLLVTPLWAPTARSMPLARARLRLPGSKLKAPPHPSREAYRRPDGSPMAPWWNARFISTLPA